MNLSPIGSIVILEIKKDTETKSGLIIPDTAKGEVQKGIIVAMGKGHLLKSGKVIPFEDFKIGDTVYFRKYKDERIEHNNKEYIFIEGLDILAVEVKK